MPIYMKIEGIDGPITHDGTKGWIEIQSLSWGSSSGREPQVPTISEMVVTKDQDVASSTLFKQALWGEGKKVTIVFVKGGDSPQEYLRITLENALISSYSTSGSGGGYRPAEFFTLNFTKITFEKGSSAHASLMIRSQDWGSMQAMKEFNRAKA